MKIKHTIKCWLAACIITGCYTACQKTELNPVPTYPDGSVADVKFSTDKPVPATINAGGEVTYYISGLKQKEGQFKFYIGGVEATVLAITDNSITVRTNSNTISGAAAVDFQGQLFYGPNITVRGNINIDPNFNTAAAQSQGSIRGIISADGTNLYIYGSFINYNNIGTTQTPLRGIAKIDVNGAFVGSPGVINRAFSGGINRLLPFGGQYLAGGSFSSYDTSVYNLGGLVRLKSDLTVDTRSVSVVNPNPIDNPSENTATVSAVNAQFTGGVLDIFPVGGGSQYVVIGNYSRYSNIYWEGSTKNSPVVDNIRTGGNVRINLDGTFDSTYNFDKTANQGGMGANGFIFNAVKLPTDDIIVTGNFVQYNGITVNRIAKLKATDGSVDGSFNMGGANGEITSMTINTAGTKILLAGPFTTYNGVAVNGVVMINADGSIDPAFNFRAITGGMPNFARKLSDGTVIVSGQFTRYDGYVRPGLVFLNADGTLRTGYNNFGAFNGSLSDVYETTSADGKKALYLVGNFNRYDNQAVGNIVKIILN